MAGDRTRTVTPRPTRSSYEIGRSLLPPQRKRYEELEVEKIYTTKWVRVTGFPWWSKRKVVVGYRYWTVTARGNRIETDVHGFAK